MGIQLRVHGPKGEEKIIDLCDSDRELRKITVTQLRDKVAGALNMSSEEIRIIYRTKPLEETSPLLEYGIKHMSTIHTVLKLPGGI
ncbi:ubiquitin-like protein ISG15 [Acanthopagrus schlegelii]